MDTATAWNEFLEAAQDCVGKEIDGWVMSIDESPGCIRWDREEYAVFITPWYDGSEHLECELYVSGDHQDSWSIPFDTELFDEAFPLREYWIVVRGTLSTVDALLLR